MRSVAKEYARIDCRVNALELGYFDAGMIDQLSETARETMISSIPAGRLGSIEDLFQACDFALNCKFLTGATLKLNGGMA